MGRITAIMESENSTLGRMLQDSTLFADLSAVVENLHEITAKIKEGEGSLGKVVTDPSLYEGLSRFALERGIDLTVVGNCTMNSSN